MPDDNLQFLERLNRGPAGLFLGQKHLRLGTTDDPLLQAIERKLTSSVADGRPYDVLLTSHSGTSAADLLDWIDTTARSIAVCEQLEIIAQYQWIGVWSSAIDPLWSTAFDNWWREVQRVFNESYRPADPRNRRRLHCTYLFGSTNRSDPSERPPLSRLDYLRRHAIAQSLTRRIPDAIGPIGTFAIEGYGLGDWLSTEDLTGIATQFQPGQCHLFSVSNDLLAVDEIRELVSEQLLVPHKQSLASILDEGKRSGIIQLGVAAGESDLQRLVTFGGQTRSVPRDRWITLSSSAHLLDESSLGEPAPLSADAKYAEFRRFLGGAEGRPDWEGIARGFSFPRDFEASLELRVTDFANQRDLPETPIIVHGATGTGKTTALASLAYRLARRRDFPVLFVDRRADQSTREQIDQFCQWAENEGGTVSIVIWDGMYEPDAYRDLIRFFSGRGRRLVLVGSTYRIPEQRTRDRTNLIHAPGELTPNEIGGLEEYLGAFDEQLKSVAKFGANKDSSFLVFLYRLLPPTRAAVRTGVVRELERVERILVERSAIVEAEPDPGTTLGWALLKAGLISRDQFEKTPDIESVGNTFTAIEDLTALVMVPAQFGLAVPLELVLRATGQAGNANIGTLLDELDLVRWIEDGAGNFLLGARSRLEAQLIVRSRLGTTSAEASYARRLIRETRESDTSVSGTAEVDFCIEFVRALGAQGPTPERYLREYPQIAGALRELRIDRGVTNPRLMLQEANLLREWSIKQPQYSDVDQSAKVSALHDAAEILSSALQLIPSGSSSRLRGILRVELATTLATRAQSLSVTPNTNQDRVQLLNDARHLIQQARAEDQESYYPIDVLTWATRDAISDDLLGPAELADSIAEVLSAFEILDPLELDPSQVERYHERRQQFADLVGDIQLADEAFNALAARNSGAGVYLRAKAIVDPFLLDSAPTSHDVERIRQALEYLGSFSELVSHDARCLNLQFNLWWLLNAGARPFAEERTTLPFDNALWREALQLMDQILRTGQSFREVPLLYLRGIAEFHIGDLSSAFATFDEVIRRSDEVRGRRRIERSYLASTPDGRASVYQGTVTRVSADFRRGEVYVDSLRRQIAFIPREFGTRDLSYGFNLGTFHIGFNFLGIIADPTDYLLSQRTRRRLT